MSATRVTRQACDYVVIGGGCVGVRVAIELMKQRKSYPKCRVIVLEKEHGLGLHASGRNSGVLHAGFYYHEDSLKAKFTRQGNIALTNYILERGIPLNQCGKLVVVDEQKHEHDFKQMEMLLRRSKLNGVPLEKITEAEAREIEPRVKTFKHALWSPSTSTASPKEVMNAFVEEAKALGVEFHTNQECVDAQWDDRENCWTVVTKDNAYTAVSHVFNASGLYSDHVARLFGLDLSYVMLPFRGSYFYCRDEVKLRTNIYPMPVANLPFLGVHTTLSVHGKTKIGPNAAPIWSREQYTGYLDSSKMNELMQIFKTQGSLFISNPKFRDLTFDEVPKLFRDTRKLLASGAERLVSGIRPSDLNEEPGPAGIRAQLIDTQTKWFAMDFIVRQEHSSTHFLNAVSPAWTCSIPMARHFVESLVTQQ